MSVGSTCSYIQIIILKQAIAHERRFSVFDKYESSVK